MSRPFLKRLLIALLVFAPAIFIAKLMTRFTVDVGTWDMWENAPLLQKWHDGTLTWHDLYAPQIQHRIVIPRLIIIAMTNLSGGDFRWENYATFGLMLLSGVLMYRLMRKTMGDSGWVAVIAFVANLLVFSPMLYQIWFWGSSLWMAIPMPCLLAILCILAPSDSPPRPWPAFISVVLLAEIATHSFAHGVLFWPIIFVYLLLQPTFAPQRTRFIMAAITLVIGVVTVGCYFSNFINVAHHAYNLKPGDYAMESSMNLANAADRAKFLGFFVGFLGNPFARTPFEDHPLASAQFIGVFVLGAFLLLAALIVFTKTGRSTWSKALPWLALAGYVVGVTLAISKGRSAMGEHRAVTTRYIVISLFLPIATMALAYLYGRAWLATRRGNGKLPSWLSGNTPSMTAACLITAFAVWQLPQWSYGLYLTKIWHNARKQAQAIVLFLPYFKPDSLKVLDKDSRDWHCVDAIKTLQGLHLLKWKPLDAPVLTAFTKSTKALPREQADVTSAKVLEDGTLELHGHARFGQAKPAEAILIAQGDKVIAMGQPAPKHMLRIYGLDYEFANVDDIQVNEMYPWAGTVTAALLKDSTAPLELWALDVAGMRISKLSVSLKVDESNKQVTIQSEAH